nr:MAG TPA: hypothetical protein [Caudoviricetes sp.]
MTRLTPAEVLRQNTLTFCERVETEVKFARMKHPGPNPSLAALSEEVGELAKELLDLHVQLRNLKPIQRKQWERVWEEAVQVAAVACRIATEGDGTLVEKPEGLEL